MTARGPRPAWRLSHDQRILGLALLAGLPAVVVALGLLWSGGYTVRVGWTLATLILVFWLGWSFALRRQVVFPLQTLSNLLAGLREGEAAVRARGARMDDALGEVFLEANSLAETIHEQRLGALEATALLRKVMAEIDVAVFAFDANNRLRLVNRAGERILAQPAERLLDRSAGELGLAPCLDDQVPRVVQIAFPGSSGRWEVRRTDFRQGGLPHRLLVLADVSRPLREEERQAWQRLMRVLGHEINNSLAPIKSIAGSLEHLASRDALPPDWQADMRRGLGVISARAEALSRFTAAYARLARLPRPRAQALGVVDLMRRAISLESRLPVALSAGPDLTIRADSDQLEQLLINLLRNAVDAALETGGGVELSWRVSAGWLEVLVQDGGPGLAQTGNLFVPFFTTKPGGSGIGLVLSQQIAEGHGGTLTLENRTDARGCVARLRLPIPSARGSA